MALLKDWLKGVDYKLLSGTDLAEVSDVVTDSRKAFPGALFVCIRGSRTDSHLFLPDVVAAGCRSVIVEKEISGIQGLDLTGVNIIKVNDSREALPLLCSARFGHPSDQLILIGITGTKGKTSSTYMFKTVFDEAGIKNAVIGTNGFAMGSQRENTLNTTPDSYILNSYFRKMCDAGARIAVMECSSQGFKMMRTKGLDFKFGIFLNIAPDHIGPLEHDSFEEYLDCKLQLMSQCGTAVINADDPEAGKFIEAARKNGAGIITTAIDRESADLRASGLRFKMGADFSGTIFDLNGMSDEEIELSIPGDYYVYNALPVIAVALSLGIGIDVIKRALKKIHVDGRMETVCRSDKFMCLVDYAHNSVSMENLIRTLRAYDHKRIVVVFGCGGNRSSDRRIGMGHAAARSADFAVITSDNSRFEKTEDIMDEIAAAYLEAGGKEENFVKIADRRDAIYYALSHAREGDIIAVIGKGHEDYQEENGVRKHFLDREEILKAAGELGL